MIELTAETLTETHEAGATSLTVTPVPVTLLASFKGQGMAIADLLLRETGLDLPKRLHASGEDTLVAWYQPGQWLAIGFAAESLRPAFDGKALVVDQTAGWVAVHLRGEVTPFLTDLFGGDGFPPGTVSFGSLCDMSLMIVAKKTGALLLLPRSGAQQMIDRLKQEMDHTAD